MEGANPRAVVGELDCRAAAGSSRRRAGCGTRRPLIEGTVQRFARRPVAHVHLAGMAPAPRRVTPEGIVAGHSSFSPDGLHLSFTVEVDGRCQIYRIGADGSNLLNLSDNDASEFAAHWGPVLRA